EKLFRPPPEAGSAWLGGWRSVLERFSKLTHTRWVTPCPKAVDKSSPGTHYVAWRVAFSFRSTFQDSDYALPTRRAYRNQPALALTRHTEQLGQAGNNASTGGGKLMAGCQRTTLDVEFGPINGAQRRLQPQPRFTVLRILPGLEGTEHLGGEGFMDFVVIEVLQFQAVARQQT